MQYPNGKGPDQTIHLQSELSLHQDTQLQAMRYSPPKVEIFLISSRKHMLLYPLEKPCQGNEHPHRHGRVEPSTS